MFRVSLVTVCALVIIATVVCVVRFIQRRQQVADIGAAFEMLVSHFKNEDYDGVRHLLSSDFEADDGFKSFDEKGNRTDVDTLVTIAEPFLESRPTYGAPWVFPSRNGMIYMPDCSWSDGIEIFGHMLLGIPSGRFYEFKKEHGEWKFTGHTGYAVD